MTGRKKHAGTRLGAAVFGWMLVFSAWAASSEPPPLCTADEFVAESVAAGQYIGAVTLVARDGAIVSLQAHGRRELDSADALPVDAIFRIYSMTKPIASVAALMLMEQGKFQLDDPIDKYLPEFGDVHVLTGGTADAPELREPKRPITI